MEYIGGPKPAGCIFCDHSRAPADRDRENLVLARGRDVFVMLNRYPFSNGHLMLAPFAHVGEFSALSPAQRSALAEAVAACQTVLHEAMHPEGFNVGMNQGACAGAGFPGHIHLHVVPRWDGDTNFMPVVADLKVMPQHLSRVFDQLRDPMQGKV